MNLPKFVVAFSLLFTKTVEAWRNEFVENFIINSNKTISIINVDEDFVNENLFSKALMNFKITSKNFIKCEEFVKIDKYGNVESPISVGKFRQTKDFKDFIDIQKGLNCDYVIFTSSLFLNLVLKCLVNSLGRFLISLTDNEKHFSDRDLIDLLNKTWTDSGALEVFLSIDDNVYSFDPFHRSLDGIYGKLNLLSDLTTTKGLRNLNGYPLNVEMFDSALTSSLVKKPKSVDDFIGPDVSVANFIAKNLNATSESNKFVHIFATI